MNRKYIVLPVVFLPVALFYLNPYPYLVGFIVGLLITLLVFPALLFYVYYFQLSEESPNPYDNPSNNSPENGKYVKISERLYEELIEDISQPKSKGDPKLYGKVTMQLGGKKKTKILYELSLKGEVLKFQGLEGSLFDRQIRFMNLSGSIIQRCEDMGELERSQFKKHKYYLELFHPNRCITYKMDYVYLFFDDLESLERWYYGLLQVCKNYDYLFNNNFMQTEGSILYYSSLLKKLKEQITMTDSQQHSPNEGDQILNTLLSRLFINIPRSKSINKKILEFLSTRLSEKMEERGIYRRIPLFTIIGYTLGTKCPCLKNFAVFPSNPKDMDLIIDYYLSYTDGDAHLTLKTYIPILNTSIPLTLKIILQSLKGKMRLTILPYPMSKIGISFVEPPEIILDYNLIIGGPKGIKITVFPEQLKSFVTKRLSELFKEKFLLPNAKYIRMPGGEQESQIKESLSLSDSYPVISEDISLSPTSQTVHLPIIIEKPMVTEQSDKNVENNERGLKKYLQLRKNTSKKLDRTTEKSSVSPIEEENEMENLNKKGQTTEPNLTPEEEEKKKKKKKLLFRKSKSKDT